jgi:hypothetical protein
MSQNEKEFSSESVPKLSNGLASVVSQPKEWFYLIENRLIISAILLGGVFAILAAVEFVNGVFSEEIMPLFYLYSALTGGNFTLITIVLSINQLVISQQLDGPGGLRQEIQDTNEYRESVLETLDQDVAPVTPTEFLDMLLIATQEELDLLQEDSLEQWNNNDEESDDIDLEEVVTALQTHIDHVNSLLERSDVGIFQALSVTLNTNYSQEIYKVRQFKTTHENHLSEETNDALDNLAVRLQQIDVTRQYLKTLFMQNELSKLSRHLLYVGVPAILTSILMLQTFAATSQALFSPQELVAYVPLTSTISVAPLAVLFAFMLRISMVSERTVAITPFTTTKQETTDI